MDHPSLILKQIEKCKFILNYPLVNVYINMENHHAINGKTHELSMAMFNSKLLT